MDDPDRELDDIDDRDLGAMLRRHADALTGPVDTDAALAVVQRRTRARRRWRVAASTLAVAAAVAVIFVAAGALIGDDRGTVRSPAASTASPVPSVRSTVAPTTAATPAPSPAAVTTTLPPSSTVTAVAPPASPTTEPASPSPTTTYSSNGGSIVVTHAGGAISLARDPAPTDGWSFRIDDDGPTRVRVRFERDGSRSEIRVDLRGDELVPEISEQ